MALSSDSRELIALLNSHGVEPRLSFWNVTDPLGRLPSALLPISNFKIPLLLSSLGKAHCEHGVLAYH